MAENENPEKNMSFKLTLMNVLRLVYPIAALCDPEFNPESVGMVEVTERGFEITVRNTETHAAANLFLYSSGLIAFHCNNPIVSKMINLNQIYQFLINAFNYHLVNPSLDDTITIFHLDGSNNLTFNCGSPSIELEVEFWQSNAEFEKFPDIVEFSCEARLKSNILRSMIYHIYVRGMQLVSVGISEKLVTVLIGLEDYSFYETKEDDEDFEARVLTEERDHQAWFELWHVEAMRKASNVGPEFRLRFLTEPAENIMSRFSMQELGYLVFVHKATLIVRNPETMLLGTNDSDDARLASISNALRV